VIHSNTVTNQKNRRISAFVVLAPYLNNIFWGIIDIIFGSNIYLILEMWEHTKTVGHRGGCLCRSFSSALLWQRWVRVASTGREYGSSTGRSGHAESEILLDLVVVLGLHLAKGDDGVRGYGEKGERDRKKKHSVGTAGRKKERETDFVPARVSRGPYAGCLFPTLMKAEPETRKVGGSGYKWEGGRKGGEREDKEKEKREKESEREEERERQALLASRCGLGVASHLVQRFGPAPENTASLVFGREGWKGKGWGERGTLW
jgi:hypothetical protein